MLLSVKERLLLLNVVPAEGDIITLKIIRKLKEDLGFSEDEIKLYKLNQSDNQVTWDDTVEQNKEIAIGEKATDVIVNALNKLSRDKKLTVNHIDLYDKFCGDK